MTNQLSEFSKRRMQRAAKEKRDVLVKMESDFIKQIRELDIRQDYVVKVFECIIHSYAKFSELDDFPMVYTGMNVQMEPQEETNGFVLSMATTHNPYNAFEPDQKRVVDVEVIYDGSVDFPAQPTPTDLVISEFISSLVEDPNDKVDILVPVVMMVEGMLEYDMQVVGNLLEGDIREVTFTRAPLTVNLRVDTTIQRRSDRLVRLSHLTDGLKEKTDELKRKWKDKQADD